MARVRLLRVITRLNIGGPALQALTLTKRMAPIGYDTTLVRGSEGEGEGSMDDLAQVLGVRPRHVPSLRRDPSPQDLPALLELIRMLRRERPRLVHTHAAKAGALGRVATVLAYPSKKRRPVLVHTFHGHSLSDYFSPRTSEVYRQIEKLLARISDKLVVVSEEVRDELVRLKVADPDRFQVIPLGFDLGQFDISDGERTVARRAVREELSIPPDALVVTLIARLVPIKRVDRFLRAATLLQDLEDVYFLVVGDGELRSSLECSAEADNLRPRLTWAGFRRDIPSICFASDVVVQCSDNEGTPASLIEASAAGVPAVSTRVGGAASVIREGTTGRLVPRDSGEALAGAIRELLSDAQLRARMGAAARAHVMQNFSLDRLIGDLDDLYRRLLGVPERDLGCRDGRRAAA